MLQQSLKLPGVIVAVSVAGVAFGVLPAVATTPDEATEAKNVIVMIADGAGYNHFDEDDAIGAVDPPTAATSSADPG